MQKTPRRSLRSYLRKPPEASDTQTLADLECQAPTPMPTARLYSIKPVPVPAKSRMRRLAELVPWVLVGYLAAIASLIVLVLAEAGGLL